MNETATSRYREAAPPDEWRGAAHCLWRQSVTGTGEHEQLVLPDGQADVIVADDGGAVLVGPATGAQRPRLAAGAALRAVRLAPERVGAAFRVPATELTDRSVPLDQVLPGPLARALVDALATGSPSACAVVGRWLRATEPDRRAVAAARALWREPALEVASVAERVGLSTRQLRRALLAEVGLGPKAFQRIGRFRRFLAAAEGSPGLGLAELAARAGYADQPHLSREARALSGLTPTQLLAYWRS